MGLAGLIALLLRRLPNMEVESTGKLGAGVVSSDHRAESGVNVDDAFGIREEEEGGLGVAGCSSIIDYPHTPLGQRRKGGRAVLCVCQKWLGGIESHRKKFSSQLFRGSLRAVILIQTDTPHT